MKHQELIQFACGISADKQSMLEFVYDTLHNTFISFEEDDKEFLKLICQEALTHEMDPVHNKYIYSIDDGFNMSKFVPSRLYLFDLQKSCPLNKFQSALKAVRNLPGECTISLTDNEEMWETLKVLKEMTKHQRINIRYLKLQDINTRSNEMEAENSSSSSDDYSSSDDENLFQNLVRKVKKPFRNLKRRQRNRKTNDLGKIITNVLKTSKNIRYFEIWNCILSIPVYNHIVQQLFGCDKLTALYLYCTKNIPTKLGKAIAAMKCLEIVDLSFCHMTSRVSRAILTGLSHCRHLEEIRLAENQLTNCLGHIFTRHTEFPFLETLDICDTEITQSDVKDLLVSLSHGKLPKLETFFNENNNDHHTLYTDTLPLLLDVVYAPGSEALLADLGINGSEDPELYMLVEQFLKNTYPSRGDVQVILAAAEQNKLKKLEVLDLEGSITHYILQKPIIGSKEILGLSELVASDKLPQLTTLDLSHNKLTDLVEVLIRASYPQLQKLRIRYAGLSKQDVTSLADAVTANHLPKLEELKLCGNNDLGSAETECQNLVESLLSVYRENTLELYLLAIFMSWEMRDNLNSLCQERNIKLHFKEILYSVSASTLDGT